MDSYSIKKTQGLCIEKDLPVPKITVKDNFTLNIGSTPIHILFPGSGHTEDSVCVYLPKQTVLFGGCSVKALSNATLGNIADADLKS